MTEPFKTADEEAQEKLLASLAYWRERAAWTDAQWLADYCAGQRHIAQGQAKGIEEGIAERRRLDDEIRRTGTEEG